MSRSPITGQAARFVVVGVANTATTYALIWLLHTRAGASVGAASAVGYVAGAVQGFILSRLWAFRGDHAARLPVQLAGFAAVNLLCAGLFGGINTLLARVLPLLVASLGSTALVMPVSFALYRWGVFRAKSAP